MSRRVLGASLAVVSLVVALGVATSAILGYRQGGPLRVDSAAGVVWPAAIGESFTWAMPLDNSTTTGIVIESIAPTGVEGLEVLGVMASNQGCEISTIAHGFPPSDVSTVDPEGATLIAQTPCALQALIGVKRTQGSTSGMIRGLRIRYRYAGAAYEDTLPWSLEVKEPGT